MLKYILRYLIGGIILVLVAGGCSSSSYQSRYEHPRKPQNKSAKKYRFSSANGEEDNSKEKRKVRRTYSDPSKQQNEFDEKPIEEYKVDTRLFLQKLGHLKELGSALTPREKLLFEIIKYVETPYKYGGNSLAGIDCSAFTQNAFNEALNFKLPRTAKEQFQIGKSITEIGKLKFGDLIFFNTTRRSYPGHVGIYIGNNLFVHASQSQGVKISSLRSSYYLKRFIAGKRVYSF